MRVLITYFGAFEGVPVNPTDFVAHRLTEDLAKGRPELELMLHELPVTFGLAGQELRRVIAEAQPDLIISTGVAVGREKVSYERVALNLDDARIKDNEGKQVVDQPIVDGAPTAYFSSLATRAAFTNAQEEGLPVELSYTAGTYVCNHVFYHLMQAVDGSGVRAGFVHIPAVTEIPESYALPGHRDTGGRAGEAPHLPADTVVQALRIILEESLVA